MVDDGCGIQAEDLLILIVTYTEKAAGELKLAETVFASLRQQHEAALGDFKSVEDTMRLNEQLTARRSELEARVAEWEELTAELDTAGD